MPEPLGQFLNGNERLPRENGAVFRRHGDERRVGEGVGVFQLFERDDVRIIVAEVIPDIDVDDNYVPGSRCESQYDNRGEQDGQPPATHDERYAGLDTHADMPTCGQTPDIAKPRSVNGELPDSYTAK